MTSWFGPGAFGDIFTTNGKSLYCSNNSSGDGKL